MPGHLEFQGFDVHRLTWADLDDLARGAGGAGVVGRLRQAERSRRLLLLRALVDQVSKDPKLAGPLPPPEPAWDLLARVQERSPAALDELLAHPYTGSWVGYTTRLLADRISGVCPIWLHIGHLHALAAAAAVRAGLDFEAAVPVWNGGAMLPTLGMARLPVAVGSPWSVARVRADRGVVTVGDDATCVRLPVDPSSDGPGWWGLRRLAVRGGGHRLMVRLDDLDPYRGLYEPVPPQRLDDHLVQIWCSLLEGAWYLVVRCLPELADPIAACLDSVVPQPAVPFRQPSASTGEAFGSAIIALPADSASLAATLIHEFQHIRLGGVLHLAALHEEDHRERFYTGWRDDPRPISGVFQGVYAFFAVTAFWRALARTGMDTVRRRAAFEFAHWRNATWRTLRELRADPCLTEVGRRFTTGIADELGTWLDEPVPADLARDAAALAADHYAGWRARFIRPEPATVAAIVDAWLAGRSRLGPVSPPCDRAPTPVPDGPWSRARADLIRLRVAEPGALAGDRWQTIPDVTPADHAYAMGRYTEATSGYRAQLAREPDNPAAWAGLGLALSAQGAGPAGRALLQFPELVRAVHRRTRAIAASKPDPVALADWIGRSAR